jgi:anti-sigma-K factor RskA
MDREDDKELWDILGRIPEAKLSPFFARDVVRTIRQKAPGFERMRSWFSWRRLAAASAVVVVVIGMAIATHHPVSQTPAAVNDSDVVAKIDPQDYDVVADLDELIAWDENSVWEEKPTM